MEKEDIPAIKKLEAYLDELIATLEGIKPSEVTVEYIRRRREERKQLFPTIHTQT